MGTQIWLSETYQKTFNYRCKDHPTSPPTPRPTKSPTPQPILHPKTPSPKPTKTPTNHTYNQRKLLQYDNNDMISFEVPPSLQYDSVLSVRSFLPSIFYPLPPLQITDSYGQQNVEYIYPFKITEIYSSSFIVGDDSTINTTSSPTMEPTIAPTSTKQGCDDLNIVIETGKSYFSLLVCGLLCSSIAMILLIAPTCHLVSIKTRRLLKQIVIGLNTLSFMLLLMAFAIWFAYFSTNINQVIESESNTSFSVCILGSPTFGESI